MIISLVITIAGVILEAIYGLFSLVTFAIPGALFDSIQYILGYLGYANGFVPVTTLVTALVTLSSFLTMWYTIKLTVWVLKRIPYVGPYIAEPRFKSQ